MSGIDVGTSIASQAASSLTVPQRSRSLQDPQVDHSPHVDVQFGTFVVFVLELRRSLPALLGERQVIHHPTTVTWLC